MHRSLDDRPEVSRFLDIPEGGVWSVAFGPGGTLVAGYDVGGVVLFDARGERLRPTPLVVEEGRVSSVAFGPGGTLAAGYDVGGVVLFDADPASWRRKAAHVANRNFTRAEWTPYFPDQPYRRTIRSLPWPHNLPEEERTQAEAREKAHPGGHDAS